ncbi:Serine/threonine-protein kinase Nek10 [Larimichthys crocea]|uniref:Uncharacterized protein n=1 Tax=Larimichthys crocea TaxID=215358 RepID=A0ACD3QVL7_LARCR|nr:Serine/threonine-protein kinase Nek10 [Larimichthys crocea]
MKEKVVTASGALTHNVDAPCRLKNRSLTRRHSLPFFAGAGATHDEARNAHGSQRRYVRTPATSYDLRRLQSLLIKANPRQEVAALSQSKARSRSQGLHPPPPQKDTSRQRSESDLSSEASELEKFSITYRDQRCFSSHPLHTLFSDILTSLVKNRLCSEWIDHAPPESVLRVLICLRLLIRDPHHQKLLHQLQGISLLARYMESVTAMYISCDEQAFAAQKLVTMTYMFQKLSVVENQRVWVIESGAHRTLVKLLSTTDSSVLLGALLALTTLAENPRVQGGDQRATDSGEPARDTARVREQVRELEGLPVLLSLLYGQHLKLLWSVAWILVQLCEDADTRTEIRSWGGVQQLLRLLSSDRQYVSDRSSIDALSSANAAGRIQREHIREELSPQEEVDNTVALQSACCTVLTELSLDDTSAHHIVQENGVCIIAKLILPQNSGPKVTSLQCYAFRTLRFLFSVERNRHLFKRLFPTDLFELFIDVGHYVRDLAAYEGLQTKVSFYTEEELDSLRESIEAVDQNRPPLKVINGYSILDHLGTGAFGSVFKVRKQSGQNLLALKEVNLHNPVFGKDKKSRDSNVEKIISELTIIKEQMTHPNVVKYYKTFLEGDKLYIVMELIEGVPLAEHFNSLKEKQQQFTEDRIWNIFIQMCRALRYLHKEKRIVHRDLTPNNIMLGEKDKVTITDFGLAKQKQENSKLTSVVGTILYSWCLSPDADQRPDIVAVSSRISDIMMRLMDGLYASQNALERRAERDRRRAQRYFPGKAQRQDGLLSLKPLSGKVLDEHRDSDSTLLCGLQLKPQLSRRSVEISRPVICKGRGGESGSLTVRSYCFVLVIARAFTFSCRLIHCVGVPKGLKSSACVTPDHIQSGSRPRPVSAGICVSQKKVRQIDDPIQRLLVQLHKIIYVTQLPPAPHHNIKRRVVERFKKSLFHHGSDPYNLKAELSKLLQASPELLELGSTSSDWFPLVHHFTGDPHAADSTGDGNLKDGVTYQQMQGIVEELLEENGYYEATHGRWLRAKAAKPKFLIEFTVKQMMGNSTHQCSTAALAHSGN